MASAFRASIPGFAGWFAGLGASHPGERRVGETFWMAAEAGTRPRGVVAVIAAGGPATLEDKAAIAARAAIDEAVARLRGDLKLEGRLLIALPTFRVGQGGDREHQLRSARAQIVAAGEALRRHPGVDVAFIAYTPSLHRILLEARRQVMPGTEVAPPIPPKLEQALVDGECVLFVGAGLSRGAGLPDWDGLLELMATELGLQQEAVEGAATPPKPDPLDLAQWYRDTFKAEGLAALIGKTFGDPKLAPRPTLAHYLAMSLRCGYVITTNYDALLERTLRALKRYPLTVIDQEDVAGTGRADGVHVVKLHGDAARPEGVVLCHDDYDQFFEKRPAMALLLEGLLLNRTFLFLGYGLRDPNFRQVFNRVGQILVGAKRPAFATSFEPATGFGPLLAEQWKRKGLELVVVPGAAGGERERNLLLWLDRLADRVASAGPPMLLAPDVEVPGPLAGLRVKLLEAGEELLALCRAEGPKVLGPAEVGPVAGLLSLLAGQGWRPAGKAGASLSGTWERLADLAGDPATSRRLLIEALQAAEGEHQAERVRAKLADLRTTPGTTGARSIASEGSPIED